jgi:hypothetical protein
MDHDDDETVQMTVREFNERVSQLLDIQRLSILTAAVTAHIEPTLAAVVCDVGEDLAYDYVCQSRALHARGECGCDGGPGRPPEPSPEIVARMRALRAGRLAEAGDPTVPAFIHTFIHTISEPRSAIPESPEVANYRPGDDGIWKFLA